MFKKALLLGGMALALVALAGPASASAHMFTDEGEPIAPEASLAMNMSGPMGWFVPGIGGLSCTASIEASIGSSAGSFESFGVEERSCAGTGAFSGCTVTGYSSEGGELFPDAETIILENLVVNYTYGGLCPFKRATYMYGGDTLTPDNQYAISSLDLSGEFLIRGENQENKQFEMPTQQGGEFEVTPAGVIGVE